MNKKGYLWGLSASALAIICIIIFILVVVFVPGVKETLIQLITAAKN